MLSRAAYPLAWRRVAAWAVDWLIISAYAVALVPLGLLLVDRSMRLPSLRWNAPSFIVLIVPATMWLAAWESGPLRRHTRKAPARLAGAAAARWRRRAAARNALKVALR